MLLRERAKDLGASVSACTAVGPIHATIPGKGRRDFFRIRIR